MNGRTDMLKHNKRFPRQSERAQKVKKQTIQPFSFSGLISGTSYSAYPKKQRKKKEVSGEIQKLR
jgi:hypothetical protein